MTKKIVGYIIITLLPLLMLLVSANAQEVSVSVVAEKEAVAQGEPLRLIFDIKHPNNATIVPPVFKTGDTLQAEYEVEVYAQLPVDTVNNKEVSLRQMMIITVWKEGAIEIPPFKYVVNSGGAIDTVFSNAVKLRVGVNLEELPIDKSRVEQGGLVTVKDEKVKNFDYPKYMRELYPLLFMDYPLYTFGDFMSNYYWVFLLLILLIAGGVYGYMYYIKWKENAPEIKIEKPKEPAHVIAFRQMEALKGKKLWQNGEIKIYYTELTNILREYIENRFGENAPEMTSDEIIAAIEYRGEIKSTEMDALRRVLTLSDFVKFAKLLPQSDEHIECFEKVEHFVRNTPPVVMSNAQQVTQIDNTNSSTVKTVVEPNKQEIK